MVYKGGGMVYLRIVENMVYCRVGLAWFTKGCDGMVYHGTGLAWFTVGLA